MSRRPVMAVTAEPAQIGWAFPPRGLRRDMAAHYVGISPSQFDGWVAKGLMPQPKQQDGVVVWDRSLLDAAFEALPDRAKKQAGQQPKPTPGLSIVESINASRRPGQRCPKI